MACTGACRKIFFFSVVAGNPTIHDANGKIVTGLTGTSKAAVQERVGEEVAKLAEGRDVQGHICTAGCSCVCQPPKFSEAEKKKARADEKAKINGHTGEIEVNIPLAGVPNTTPPYTLTIPFTGYGAKEVNGTCQ